VLPDQARLTPAVAELDRLKAAMRHARLAMAASPRGVPPERLKALRIRLRIFLDTHRRTLARADAAELRSAIEHLDRVTAASSLQRNAASSLQRNV